MCQWLDYLRIIFYTVNIRTVINKDYAVTRRSVFYTQMMLFADMFICIVVPSKVVCFHQAIQSRLHNEKLDTQQLSEYHYVLDTKSTMMKRKIRILLEKVIHLLILLFVLLLKTRISYSCHGSTSTC